MGMYTELFISTRVKDDSEIVAVLKHMVDGTETPQLPDHPLFQTLRWRSIFRSSSYYFVPRSFVLFEHDDIGRYWVLMSRFDLKNYDGEIEKFIDWLEPHLDLHEGEMIGYSRYEETETPTIIYKKAAR